MLNDALSIMRVIGNPRLDIITGLQGLAEKLLGTKLKRKHGEAARNMERFPTWI